MNGNLKHAKKALKVFIELGPSYIKLGQWLSSRADLLPSYLEELAKLQDKVPPAEFSKVKPIIESELGKLENILNRSHLCFRCQSGSGLSGNTMDIHYKN